MKHVHFLLCLMLVLAGCQFNNKEVTTKNTTEQVTTIKECDDTCKVFSDDELLKAATIMYVAQTLNTDLYSDLNTCVSFLLLKNLSKINKRTFNLCLENLAVSTHTGYNSTIQYLINKDTLKFMSVATRCASAQYSDKETKLISYIHCI